MNIVPAEKSAPRPHAPITDVLARVGELVKEGRFTVSEIARAINRGVPSVSTALAGKYGASTHRIEMALIAWMRRIGEPLSDDDAAGVVIETDNVRAVIKVCADAHENGEINAIVGDPGLGKSVGIRAWSRQAKAAAIRHIIVTCHVAMTLQALLRAIADELKIGFVRGASWRIRDEIQKHLHAHPTVIIVDEAQHLGIKCLEALRDLKDQGGAPLVVAGSQALYWTLSGTGKRRVELDQIRDRLNHATRLQRLSKTETSQFAKAWWGDEIEVEVLGRICTHAGGNPRRLVRLLEHARAMCERSEKPLAIEIIERAVERLERLWNPEGVTRG